MKKNDAIRLRKLTLSGNLIECVEYTHYPGVGGKRLSQEERAARKEKKDRYNARLEKPDQEKILGSVARSKIQLKRLIHANVWRHTWEDGKPCLPIFITLTFAENIKDVRRANYEFTKFIQRLNYYLYQDKKNTLKYVGVPQFQKRGALHYHIIFFNLPFINQIYDEMRRIWGEGIVNVRKVDHVKKVGAYVARYMMKDAFDGRLWGQKRYFASHGLKKKMVVHGNLHDVHIELITRAIPPPALVWHTCFDTQYSFGVEYTQYMLESGQTVFDLPIDSQTRELLHSIQ